MSYKEFVKDRYSPWEKAPWWKGIVYQDMMRNEAVVAPLGFNLLFQLAREVYFFVRCKKFDYYQRQYLKKQGK